MTTEQSPPRCVQSLEPAAIERLHTLLNELADMNIALGRLFKSGDLQDYPLALIEIQRAMDSRLSNAMTIVFDGKEEG